MKYAFNTWPYSSFPVWVPSYPLEDTIRRIAAIGYDGIEIGCAAPHAWPDFVSAERRRELRALMSDVNLTPVSLLPAPGGGPGVNTASCMPEERAFAINHYKQVVDLASDLGAGLVLYIAGWLSHGTSRLDGFAWSAEALREIGAHAQERGITIAVEPTPTDSNLIEKADDALELMRKCGLPNVKVMFDTYPRALSERSFVRLRAPDGRAPGPRALRGHRPGCSRRRRCRLDGRASRLFVRSGSRAIAPWRSDSTNARSIPTASRGARSPICGNSKKGCRNSNQAHDDACRFTRKRMIDERAIRIYAIEGRSGGRYDAILLEWRVAHLLFEITARRLGVSRSSSRRAWPHSFPGSRRMA